MDAERNLQLPEALVLCSALVGRSALHEIGDVLLVKGVSLGFHRLRFDHVPQDVDALVRPCHLHLAVGALKRAGWSERDAVDFGPYRSQHSVTLTNPDWPCDADIHDRYPGMLTHPDRSFDVLWVHRERMIAGGCSVWVPDRASSIVIWALHSLRGTATQARHADELLRIREVVLPSLSEAGRLELADRIIELGADEPLRAVPEFAEIIGDRHGPQAPGALDAWNAEFAQAHEATPWLQVLRDARPSERPWLLFRAVWPSAHDLRLMDEALVDSPFGRVQSRGRRAWRLVRRIVERRRRAR